MKTPADLAAAEANAWLLIVRELNRCNVFESQNAAAYEQAARVVAAHGLSRASHDALRECFIYAPGRVLVLLAEHPRREHIFRLVALACYFGQRREAIEGLRALGLTLTADEINPDVIPAATRKDDHD